MSNYWWTYPTAIQDHQCDICGRGIKSGEKYGRCFGVDGAEVDVWKECDHCQAVVHLYGIEGYDGNRPSSDDMGEWECTSVTELRHKAQWLKHWTRNDGTLYPTPERASW